MRRRHRRFQKKRKARVWRIHHRTLALMNLVGPGWKDSPLLLTIERDEPIATVDVLLATPPERTPFYRSFVIDHSRMMKQWLKRSTGASSGSARPSP